MNDQLPWTVHAATLLYMYVHCDDPETLLRAQQAGSRVVVSWDDEYVEEWGPSSLIDFAAAVELGGRFYFQAGYIDYGVEIEELLDLQAALDADE